MVRILILSIMLAGPKELKLVAVNLKILPIHVKRMLAKVTNVKIMQHVSHLNMLGSRAIARATKPPAGLEDIVKLKVTTSQVKFYGQESSKRFTANPCAEIIFIIKRFTKHLGEVMK